MSCIRCGREPEKRDGRVVEVHHLGCEAARKPQASGTDLRNAGPGPEDQCARGGCDNPRAAQGKGPRPKFCEDHKVKRSK